MAYGMRPLKTLGGGYTSGGVQEWPMGDNLATAIFNGDGVEIASGLAVVATGVPQGDDSADAVVGFLVGCRYVDAQGQAQWGHYYPASAGVSDVYALVAGGTDMLFRVQGNAAFVEATHTGIQVQLAVGAGGDTSTGNSSWVADIAGGTDTAGGVFVVGVVHDGENEFSSTPDLIVRVAPLAYWLNS